MIRTVIIYSNLKKNCLKRYLISTEIANGEKGKGNRERRIGEIVFSVRKNNKSLKNIS